MSERLKILVAGMQENLSSACAWALERRGFEPISVQTAEEAIAVAQKIKPKVAILAGNINLSLFSKGWTIFDNTSGEKLAKRLCEQDPDIKIVAAIPPKRDPRETSSKQILHQFGDRQVSPNCVTELAKVTAFLINAPTKAA